MCHKWSTAQVLHTTFPKRTPQNGTGTGTTMKYEMYPCLFTASDDEDVEQEMPAQLLFDWNLGAVESFIHKLNGVNKEDIDFPQFFGPFRTSQEGMKTFQVELLKILTRRTSGVTLYGENYVQSAVVEDYSSFSKVITNLAVLPFQPWVRAVLEYGEPLPNKLAKVSVSVRGKPHDVIEFQHPLIY